MKIINKNLTDSGMGIELLIDDIDNVDFRKLRLLTSTYKFVLIKNLKMNIDEFSKICKKLGEVANPETWHGEKETFTLNGSTKKDKVLLGRGSLPLHTDGSILNKEYNFLAFYCKKNLPLFKNDNRTLISDQSVLDSNDNETVQMILKKGIEYQVIEKGWFGDPSISKWYNPKSIERSNSRLNLAFPFDQNETKIAWKTRISGLPEVLSFQLLKNLERIFLDKKYCYSHQWETGDFILLDNYNTLHGRTKISGQREIFNTHII